MAADAAGNACFHFLLIEYIVGCEISPTRLEDCCWNENNLHAIFEANGCLFQLESQRMRLFLIECG